MTSLYSLCEICKKRFTQNYCTANVCQQCCENNQCPYREECLPYNMEHKEKPNHAR